MNDISDLMGKRIKKSKKITNDKTLFDLTQKEVYNKKIKEFASLIEGPSYFFFWNDSVVRTYDEIDKALKTTGISTKNKHTRDIVDTLTKDDNGLTMPGFFSGNLYLEKTINPQESYRVHYGYYSGYY